jgi:hypothetical protein
MRPSHHPDTDHRDECSEGADGARVDASHRLEWYTAQVHDRRASGDEYRRVGNALRSLLASRERPAAHLDAALEAALAARRKVVAGPAAGLAALDDEGELTASRDAVAASLIHMHANRPLGRQTREEVVLGVLLRTWRGPAR